MGWKKHIDLVEVKFKGGSSFDDLYEQEMLLEK